MTGKFLWIFGMLGVLGLGIFMKGWRPEMEEVSEMEDKAEVSVEAEGEDLWRNLVERKLTEIRIGDLNLRNCKLEEAVEFLRLRSVEHDFAEEDSMKGVGFIVQSSHVGTDDGGFFSQSGAVSIGSRTINIEAEDVSLIEAIDLVCEEVGATWEIGPQLKIVIQPGEDISTKGGFLPKSEPEEDDPFAAE